MNVEAGTGSGAGPAAVQVIDLTPEVASALERLAVSLGLYAVRIDLDGCADKAEFLERTAAALGFPAWFGGNWDAFFDCLADLGWRPVTRPQARQAPAPAACAPRNSRSPRWYRPLRSSSPAAG